MKATIDFDEQLYRRLKVEAARRGRTVRDLVTEGVRHVLDHPAAPASGAESAREAWRPVWLGSLAGYAESVEDHSMPAVRASVARGRSGERQP